jgi:hypothetical protein
MSKINKASRIIVLIILMLFAILLFVSIFDTNDGHIKSAFEQEYDINADVSLAVKDAPISLPLPDFVTVVLANDSSKFYVYGEGSETEKKIDGVWSTLRWPNDVGVALISYPLEPDSSVEHEFWIAPLHDKMDAGEYRFILRISEQIGRASCRERVFQPV